MRRTLLCLGFLALAPIAQAQQAPPIQTLPLQFQFSPPGARAMGMGAAFIAIADDATASQSNPAGLVILTRPEISAHLRLSRFDSEFENPATGDPQTFTEKVTIPSFFSFVYPIKNAAIGIYYQQATHFKSSAAFNVQDEIFPGSPANIGISTDVDLLLDQIGASVAFKLGEKVALGASVRTSRLRLDNRDIFSYADVDGDRYTFSEIVDDSNRQITFNGGVLFNPNGKVSVGGFYNQGGEYDLTRVDTGDSSGPFFGNLLDEGPTNVAVTQKVPGYGGGGLAFRPTDRWILSADVVFVNYSVLSRTAEEIAEDDTLEVVEDGTQFHFGTEYTFLSGQMPISVRAGVYTDPDHDSLRNIDSAQTFFTFGTGFVIGGKFQIDFAAALSGKTKEALISAVYRF